MNEGDKLSEADSVTADDDATSRSIQRKQVSVWCDGKLQSQSDQVAEEVPVALVYNGVSHVVMMATPQQLDDFALGFSLTERIVDVADQFYGVERIARDFGIELSIAISNQAFNQLKHRRRNLAGKTGCGLCGAESLAQVQQQSQYSTIAQSLQQQGSVSVSHQAIQSAITALPQRQDLQRSCGAVHGAAWCNVDGEVLLLREDVGRHNALDKLLGAKRRLEIDDNGFVLITSRASYEMVAKVASQGVQLLVAVSAPTTLAIELADRLGLSLIGFARKDRQLIYAHGQRLLP